MAFNISRYYGQERMEFDVEVITPMFLGGADQKTAELRSASLKGLLRFWWRAASRIEDAVALREKENHIFGSAETNKSCVSIHTEDEHVKYEQTRKFPSHPYSVKGHSLNILDYLAYGLKQKNEFVRDRIEPESRFKITLIFNDKKSNNKDEIIRAFSLLVHYGGLGSRNRNGYGGVYIDNLEKEKISSQQQLAPFPAITKETRCFEFSEHNTWHDALAELGFAYKDARLSLENRHRFSKRSYISAPLMDSKENKAPLERHAKPYFLHVGKEGGGYKGQILYMPYKYLAGRKDFSEKKLIEYLDACNSLNKELELKSRGDRS